MNYTKQSIERFSKDNYAISTTGVKIDYADVNYAKCSLEVNDRHSNIYGFVMGGAIFTLADCTFGVAANVDASSTVTLSSTINYLSPTKGPKLFAEAKCIKSGHNVCFYEVTVTDSSEKIIATLVVNGFKNNK